MTGNASLFSLTTQHDLFCCCNIGNSMCCPHFNIIDNFRNLPTSTGYATEDLQPRIHNFDGSNKRSTDFYDDLIIQRRSMLITDIVRNSFTWPTESGITEEEATEFCRSTLTNSQAFDHCHGLFGESIFDPVKSCVEDIKVRIISHIYNL